MCLFWCRCLGILLQKVHDRTYVRAKIDLMYRQANISFPKNRLGLAKAMGLVIVFLKLLVAHIFFSHPACSFFPPQILVCFYNFKVTQNGVILESSAENFTVVLVIKVLPKNVWECTSNCRMGKREDGAVMKNICWIKTRAFFCGKIEFVHFSDFKTYESLFAGLKCLQVAASHLDTVLEKLKDILDSAGKSLLQRCIAESYCNLLLKCLLTVISVCNLQFAKVYCMSSFICTSMLSKFLS